jgi:MFS superfamily sulfate permease-like transporter
MAVARLGFLADLISQPVLAGFLSGVGVSLVIGKLPGVLGIPASGTTWDELVATVTNLGEVNVASAVLGLGTVAVVLLGERLLPRLPAALVAVVLFSALAAVMDATGRGVEMIGALPPGLPSLALPTITAGEIPRLASAAASIAVVVLAQSAAVARSFGTKNGYRVDENADLLALATANAGSAVTGGFAINGSPPRTAAGDGAGGRSQVINLVGAGVIGLLLVFGSGLFAYVPSPVLDAVVLAIGIGLVKVAELGAVRRARRSEYLTALLALVVVAFVGVEQGVLLAVIASLADRLRRQYRPWDEVLVHDGTVAPRLEDRLGRSGADLDGVLVYRFGAPLFFENATYFEDRVTGLVATARAPVRWIVVDAAAMSDIDYTGIGVLRRLATATAAAGGRLVLTELSPAARDTVQRAGLRDDVDVVPRLEHAVAALPRPTRD